MQKYFNEFVSTNSNFNVSFISNSNKKYRVCSCKVWSIQNYLVHTHNPLFTICQQYDKIDRRRSENYCVKADDCFWLTGDKQLCILTHLQLSWTCVYAGHSSERQGEHDICYMTRLRWDVWTSWHYQGLTFYFRLRQLSQEVLFSSSLEAGSRARHWSV